MPTTGPLETSQILDPEFFWDIDSLVCICLNNVFSPPSGPVTVMANTIDKGAGSAGFWVADCRPCRLEFGKEHES